MTPSSPLRGEKKSERGLLNSAFFRSEKDNHYPSTPLERERG